MVEVFNGQLHTKYALGIDCILNTKETKARSSLGQRAKLVSQKKGANHKV